MVWLPSLVTMLQKIEMGTSTPQLIVELSVALQFVNEKLQAPELAFKLKSGEDVNSIQVRIPASKISFFGGKYIRCGSSTHLLVNG